MKQNSNNKNQLTTKFYDSSKNEKLNVIWAADPILILTFLCLRVEFLGCKYLVFFVQEESLKSPWNEWLWFLIYGVFFVRFVGMAGGPTVTVFVGKCFWLGVLLLPNFKKWYQHKMVLYGAQEHPKITQEDHPSLSFWRRVEDLNKFLRKQWIVSSHRNPQKAPLKIPQNPPKPKINQSNK
jgi:hypothetical protein